MNRAFQVERGHLKLFMILQQNKAKINYTFSTSSLGYISKEKLQRLEL